MFNLYYERDKSDEDEGYDWDKIERDFRKIYDKYFKDKYFLINFGSSFPKSVDEDDDEFESFVSASDIFDYIPEVDDYLSFSEVEKYVYKLESDNGKVIFVDSEYYI